jgi:hypothetical protein
MAGQTVHRQSQPNANVRVRGSIGSILRQATAAAPLGLPETQDRAASIVPTLPERDRTANDVCRGNCWVCNRGG